MCTLKEKKHICISGRKQVVQIKLITVDDKTKLKVTSLVVCLYFLRQIHFQPFSYLFVMPNREMTGRYSIYCTCIIYTLHCFPMYIIIVYFCSYFFKIGFLYISVTSCLVKHNHVVGSFHCRIRSWLHNRIGNLKAMT